MSIQRLRYPAKEGGSKVIVISLVNSSNVTIIPQSMNWTFSDLNGNIINERNNIDYEVDSGFGSGGSLSASMGIILNGQDFLLNNKVGGKLCLLTVEGTYDSSYGTGLPFKDQCSFVVDNLISIREYKITLEEGTFWLDGGATNFTVA